MKKYFIIFGIMAGILSANAAEQYNASTYSSDMKKNMQDFKQIYELFTNTIENRKAMKGIKYTKYNDVLNYTVIPSNFKRIENGFMVPGRFENNGRKMEILYNIEIKFYKLKEVCSSAPAVPSQATACGKIIVDVNGFNTGTNKYFSDKNTLLPKERGVLWMYSDSVKASPNSIEDIIITITK